MSTIAIISILLVAGVLGFLGSGSKKKKEDGYSIDYYIETLSMYGIESWDDIVEHVKKSKHLEERVSYFKKMLKSTGMNPLEEIIDQEIHKTHMCLVPASFVSEVYQINNDIFPHYIRRIGIDEVIEVKHDELIIKQKDGKEYHLPRTSNVSI